MMGKESKTEKPPFIRLIKYNNFEYGETAEGGYFYRSIYEFTYKPIHKSHFEIALKKGEIIYEKK